MTQTEYKQKKRECWREYFHTHPLFNTAVMRISFDWTFDRAFALGQQDAQLLNNPKQLDAEEETKMLCVSRKRVLNLYNSLKLRGHHLAAESLINLFGFKCLPDLLNEDNFVGKELKPAEPKFKVGDKVRCTLNRKVYCIKGRTGKYHYALSGWNHNIHEDYLEPYTEPVGTKDDTKGDTKDDTKDATFTDECKSLCKSPDRLHIAAMLAAGMLANDVRCYPIDRAIELADALIAESGKGGTL